MTTPDTTALDALFRVDLPPRPYPGLRPFEKDEWPIFFGRERMADAIVAQLIDKRLLVVHGDSGCGKSSLIRAAVLPCCRDWSRKVLAVECAGEPASRCHAKHRYGILLRLWRGSMAMHRTRNG